MKNIILAFVILMGVQISAQAFGLSVQCSFNQAQGSCFVFNTLNRPVQCRIQARGQTVMGFWAKVYENVIIYPGQYGYAYVYAKNPYNDPLVYVDGSANCGF